MGDGVVSEGEGEGEDVCADIFEHQNVVAAALDARFTYACTADNECGFDGGQICGNDTAESAYALAEEDAWRAAMEDEWDGFCVGCGFHVDTFLDAAACVDGRCILASQAQVCPAVFALMEPRARAAVDDAFRDDCADDVDCAVVVVVAFCGDQRLHFVDAVAAVAADGDHTVDIGSDCGDGLAANVRCNGTDNAADVGNAVCVDGHCQLP